MPRAVDDESAGIGLGVQDNVFGRGAPNDRVWREHCPPLIAR